MTFEIGSSDGQPPASPNDGIFPGGSHGGG